jgi:lysozyme
MQISARGIALIQRFESCRLEAYDDGGGVWTIGWGHTKGVTKGDTCSQAEADEWLLEDIEAHDINPLLGSVPTKQCEFDAMTSLAFNIGLERYRNSTVLKRHKLGNRIGAANAFLLWRYDNGKMLPGLLRRREAERRLYLGEM